MPSGLEYGTHVPFTGPVRVGFSDSERSFISGAVLVAERMGDMYSSGRSNPELNIGECKCQTRHPLYEYGTRDRELRIPQDRQGKMECVVRLMTVLLRWEMDVLEMVGLMCVSCVVGPS